MKAGHRRTHVVLWVVVLAGTLAIIVAGWMQRGGETQPGPSMSAWAEP